jgi:hypothetical protein
MIMPHARLLAAARPAQLRFVASAINALTVRNRDHYDGDRARLIEGNEAIHRLSGHLRDLVDAGEELTESRADGICEQLQFLVQGDLERLLQHTPL